MTEAAAFATVGDLELRYRPLAPQEREKAAALLDDAAALIVVELADAGIPVRDGDAGQAAALRSVSCSVVRRALSCGDGAAVSQESVTTGPFSKQRTYANPTGDLYLTKQERRLLGIPQSGAGHAFIRPVIERGERGEGS